MENDELAKKIITLQENIKTLKTSQKMGTGTGILIPVYTLNQSFTNLNYQHPTVTLVFTSENTLRPIVTPYVTATHNGSLTDSLVVSYDYSSVGTDVPGYSPNNPLQTLCNIWIQSEYGISGSANITGMIYANCRGIMTLAVKTP